MLGPRTRRLRTCFPPSPAQAGIAAVGYGGGIRSDGAVTPAGGVVKHVAKRPVWVDSISILI